VNSNNTVAVILTNKFVSSWLYRSGTASLWDGEPSRAVLIILLCHKRFPSPLNLAQRISAQRY